MDRDKLERFIKKLHMNNEISFYLYNVKYIIMIKNKSFIIKNSGSSHIYLYEKLGELFKEYKVYGESLVELFDDIIIN